MMPVYEYKCRDCKKEFEVMQRITAEPLTKCEACSGTLDKLISQSAFVLKGTGWYQTDFADKKPPSTESVPVKPNEAKPAECGSCPAAASESGKKE
jgi:putative FmdB family regulatory protein